MGIVRFFIISLLLCSSNKSMAFASHEWFASAQSRSMGMATTAFADDHTAIFVNPAGLAQVRETEWRLPQLFNVGIGRGFFDLLSRMQDLDTGGSTTIAEQLQEFDGTSVGVDLNLLEAYWVKERFGLAFNPISVNGTLRVKTPSLLFAQLDVFNVIEGGVAAAYGHPFWDNRLRIGLTWKPIIYRSGLRTTLENNSISTLTEDFSSLVGAGVGTDFDFGMQSDFVIAEMKEGARLRLLSGLAWQNLLASNFPLTFSEQSQSAPALQRRLNIGLALRLENEGIIEPTASVEFRDIGTGYDEFLEFFHMAMQLKFTPREFYTTYVRFHLAKGNLGGGLGFEWNVFELEAGTYAVNLGPGPGIGVDRRYYMQGALSF